MKTKKQFTNRILSLALALVMVMGMLPMTSLTASAATTKRTTKLSLSVTSGNIQNETEGWSWVKGEDVWTLTLNNANIEVADDVAVYLDTSTNTEPRNINIVLNGDNRIVSTKSSTQGDISSLGIKIEDLKAGMPNVTFSGSGTLLVKGQSCGIYSANNIIFDNANVTVEGGYYGCINLASTDGSNGNSLIIKNNSIVNVNHSTSDGNAYKNTIDAVYGNITVENSTLNVSTASNGGTLTLVKAAKTISVSNSTLALNVTGTGTTWRWGVAAPTISISNSTVNATNIYNLASMVVGGGSNNVVTMTNVSGAFLHTVSVASSSATMENCNIYHCSRNGDVKVYGNVALPESVSEITGKLSFKNSTDSLSIPAGKSMTFSGTPYANTGTIINNGSLIIYSPNTFNGSSCTLSGTGDFLLMTEVTSDCIVVPDDLVYTGSVLLTQDTDKVYLQEPQGTVTILKTAFKQRLLDKANWVLSFDRTVLNAGEYTATFTNNGKTITKPFDVKAADIAGATVTLNPTSGTYDGTEQKPTVSVVWNNMPLLENTHYTVSYVDNVNASGATVLATAYIDGINNFTGRKEAVFEISKAQLTEIEVKQQGTLTYNGQVQTPTVTAKAKSVNNQPITFTYSTSPYSTYGTIPTFTNAGTYTVYFKASAPNHNDVTGSFTVTVDKADQSAPAGIGKTDETISKKEDGKITGVTTEMEYRKDGENTYATIMGSTIENLAAGKYFVRVKGDSNRNPSPETEVTVAAGRKLTVKVPQNQVGYTMTTTTPEVDYFGSIRVEFKLLDGYSMTDDFQIYNGTEPVGFAFINGVYGLNFVGGDFDFTVEGVADITPPTAEIAIKDNKWTSFLNDLTFGLFFKETQDVTITANDVGSGVSTTHYYLSDREMERAEVRAITDWTEYTGTFKINPDHKYVIYAKVADNSGNTVYLNSTGIVLDATAPVLYGIENGGVYHGDKIFKAIDDNFLKIEVDGVDITDTTEGDDEFKIVADNAEHTVTVTDKVGNVTEYKITVYKKYMVTFTNGDGGAYEKDFKYGEVITIPTNEIFEDTFRKTGYTLTEWQGYTEGMTMPLENLTFTAVYTPNRYTVAFDANGGEAIDPITVTFGEKYGSLPSSAITGLSGGNKNWYLVDAYGTVTETNIKNLTLVTIARDHTLFIKRSVLAPNISIALTVPGGISDSYQYYIPGASQRVLTATVGNMNTDILDYTYQWYKDGTLIEGATSNVLTLDGNVSDSGTYKVEVTATLKDGTNIVVTSDTATASKEQKVKILHAANTLRYDANGGEGGPQSSYTGGTSLNVSKDVPTRAHYDFIGWNTKQDGTGDSYKAEDAYTFTADGGNGGCVVTLYAQWELVEYTVTYTADGEPVSTEKVIHGKDAILPAVPSKDGYVGKWDADGKNIIGDTTISAVYTAIPVVKPDEVKPEDKTNLENTKVKLEEMLDDDSYTEDDRKDIQEAIDSIDDALDVIGNVEAVEELIDKLPEKIAKDDEDAIKAADDAYNALTDYEKSLVDADVKKSLEDAKVALEELNKPADTTSPDTGDNSNLWLWFALLFVSGAGFFGITLYDRKRKVVNKR